MKPIFTHPPITDLWVGTDGARRVAGAEGSGGWRQDALEDAPAGAREHGDAYRHGDKGQEGGAADGIVRVEHCPRQKDSSAP